MSGPQQPDNIAERLTEGTAVGEAGELLLDSTLPLGHLLWNGASAHVWVVDGEGRVTSANRAATALTDRDPVGLVIAELLVVESRDTLARQMGLRDSTAFLLHFAGPLGEPLSLRCVIAPRRAGCVLFGEPPWDDQRALALQLQALNGELAVLVRENARQERALKRAHAELQTAHTKLRDAHWHVKKIADVLPMCVECRKVRTSEETWEDVASYLIRSTDFLSHGYCTHCAALLEALPSDLPE